VLITPHSSSSTEATADRRWSAVAANLDRFACGEKLENIVFKPDGNVLRPETR
jgi:phosphoglycerate dehydrogenase-like enzyme